MEDNIENVVWQEGMLLRPEHFQQNDHYWHHQLYTRATLLNRHQWGFSDITLNQQYLRMGKIGLAQAAGIFPDGTLFDISHTQKNPVINIAPGTGNQLIYLSLPLNGSQHQSMHKQDQARQPRTICFEADKFDQNSADKAAVKINCGRLNLQLRLQEEDYNGWIRMPVCHIQEVSGDGKIILSPNFHPTCLDFKASAFMTNSMQMLIGLLEQRVKVLALRMHSDNAVSNSEIGDFMMLQSINRALPRLKYWASVNPVHPEVLYLEWLTLLGDLSTYSSNHYLLDQPSYQHFDQKSCLTAIIEPLQQLLSEVLAQHVIALSLDDRQYGMQVAVINESNLVATATWVLAAHADAAGDVLQTLLPAKLKLSAVERINNLVNFNLPGIRLKPLAVAPRQLPFLANYVYFILDIQGEELRCLQESSGLAIHDSTQLEALDLKLWAIRED